MKLSELLLAQSESAPSHFAPGDRVRIKGEKTVLRVVRVMTGSYGDSSERAGSYGDSSERVTGRSWIAVEGGPYAGHAITRCALEKVEG